MATIVLLHGGLGAEMDAERFWVRPGIVKRLSLYGFAVHAPDRPHYAPSWEAEVAHLRPGLPAGDLVVVGGSNGCSVAALLASALGPRVTRLVLSWPATVDTPPAGVDPRVAPLLAGETLRGVTDDALRSLPMPVAVVPSAPPNRSHQRSTVDALLGLVPRVVELAGTPEPPVAEFSSFVDSYVASVASVADPAARPTGTTG